VSTLVLASSSRSEDAGFLALADVDAVARQLGADYRLVGGHMVSILVALHGVNDVPHRETNDADLGAEFSVVADQRLIHALADLGYIRPSASNRFVRHVGDELNAVIDVLAPSYTGKHEPNQQHGSLVVDEIPGLGYALATAPAMVEIEARLTTGDTVRTTSQPPAPLPATCLKLLAWNSRHAAKDAEDIWRLLAVCHAAGVGPDDWPDSATPRDALTALKRFAAIDSIGLRHLSADRATHARIRALAHAVGGV
jgi:hypothetical protein